MVPVARKNLLAEKARFFIAVGGVAFAVFLIVTMQSLYQGLRSGAGEFARQFPADLWVVQRGAADLAESSSYVPVAVEADVASQPGVRATVKALGRLLRVSIDQREDAAFFLALEEGPTTSLALQGLGYESPPVPGQVIAHTSIASPGDVIKVAGRELLVAGNYGGGTPFTGYSLMSFQDASELFGLPGYVSYIVVFLDDPQRAESVVESVTQAHPNLEVLTSQEITRFVGQQVDSFLPVVGVLLGIAFLVGAAVVSLIVYTATVERARDYAVLKALGASSGRLYRVILTQSFMVGVAGFVLGVPLAAVVANSVERVIPEFLTQFDWRSVLLVFFAVVLMSLVAAYIPARRIAVLDPAMVFRA